MMCDLAKIKYIAEQITTASAQVLTNSNYYLTQLVREYLNTRSTSVSLSPAFDFDKAILPPYKWMRETLQKFAPSITVISAIQEYALWNEIFIKEQKSKPAFSSLNTAHNPSPDTILQLAEAWHLTQQWQLPLIHQPEQSQNTSFLSESKTSATADFYHLMLPFKQHLENNQWCTVSELPNLLIKIWPQISKGSLSYEHLILFEPNSLSQSPQEKLLFQTIQNSGVAKVTYIDNEQDEQSHKHCSRQHRLLAADVNAEIRLMAAWAHKTLQSNPQAAIGCIVPELESLQPQIERIFTEVFYPENLLAKEQNAADSPLLAFRFLSSKASPLAKEPIITTALTILALWQKSLNLFQWQQLIISPFCADNWLNRSQSAMRWDKLKTLAAAFNRDVFSHDAMLPLLKKIFPPLVNSITKLERALQNMPAQTKPSAWMIFFAEQLKSFGWPGKCSLNCHENQVLERWNKLTNIFASLDLIFPEGLSYAKAWQQLCALSNHECSNVPCELCAPNAQQFLVSSPITVLDVETAWGLNFSNLWIMSMDADKWPRAAKPNQFLPQGLQAKLNLPKVSPSWQARYALSATKEWQHGADEIIYSYAAHDKKQNATRVSPLLRHIPETTSAALMLEPTPSIYARIQQENKLELFEDNTSANIAALKFDSTIYSSKTLDSQALCPFQAFATFRLKADTDTYTSLCKKLPIQARSKLIRKTLAQIWGEIKDQKTLKQLLEHNYAHLNVIVQKALESSSEELPLKPSYVRREIACLRRLLLRWLSYESQREPFTVAAANQKCEYAVGQIKLNLHIARIDKLQNDTLAIIDYKTGKEVPNIDACFENPPTAAKLPLASLAMQIQFAAVPYSLMFAHVYPESKKPFAIAGGNCAKDSSAQNYENNCYKNSEAWEKKLKDWQQSFTRLADDFSRGVAYIPNACRAAQNSKSPCQKCGLKLLCRVKEKF